KARAAGTVNEKHWADLQDVARRAETLAGSELADPALGERLRSLLGQIRQDEKNGRMTAQLERIRLESLAAKSPDPAFSNIRNAYAAAFQDYGLPVTDLAVAEAAAQVRESEIKESLVAGLDAWAVWDARARGTAWKNLLAVAQPADLDPWRRECRD